MNGRMEDTWWIHMEALDNSCDIVSFIVGQVVNTIYVSKVKEEREQTRWNLMAECEQPGGGIRTDPAEERCGTRKDSTEETRTDPEERQQTRRKEKRPNVVV
ncbi:hypothetical protein RIF29_14917 [Crotalaria pallida]|uniref:Uncharacterized protein n=1 Tax=Crotalaria pallida TaxID=3830 RepID=A0AAN9FJ22_CROPI